MHSFVPSLQHNPRSYQLLYNLKQNHRFSGERILKMEVEMEDDNSSGNTVVEFTFTAVEIDLDYEFEAARFFDFTREETTDEAREAEMWFDSVESYPPSPFAVRLLSREESENANVPLESKGYGNTNQLDSVSDVARAPEDSAMALCNTDAEGANGGVSLELKSCFIQGFQNQQSTSAIPRGLTVKESTRNDNYKSKTKSSWKPSFPRTSTLMKPTASILAKQNRDRVMDHSRFQKLANNSSGVESQAAKRQKLEGGHLCKATDAMQQANLVHKAPKREGAVNGNAGHDRLRITVPRPPELATAQRARRIRPKGDNGTEHVASKTPGFRALPLNRKIFEAPSLLHQRSTPQLPEFQEFHLKTSERAVQNAYAVPSTSACSNNFKVLQKPSLAFAPESSSRESKGHVAIAPKQEDSETIHRFKALPLNKKIFSSKGDLGVFRNSKRETTVTMAFNFQTEKRAQHAPPVDLFNKLSLASEVQHDSRHPSIFSKMKHLATEMLLKIGSKQVFDSDKVITEGDPLSRISSPNPFKMKQ